MSYGDAETLPQSDRLEHNFTTRHRQSRTALALRMVVPAVALGVLVVFSVLYWRHSAIAFDVLRWWGIPPPFRNPFLDLRYVFAGIECWGKGVDVYISNPCDPLGRPHGYSPLWLRFAFLPSQQWTPIAGVLVDGLFALSLAAFPPPQNRGELAVVLAAALSPPVAFALQRANVDVIIFMMLLAVAGLWIRGPSRRLVGYGIVTFAGLLKIYPLIVLGLALREGIKRGATIFAVSGLLLIGFVAYFHTELIEMTRNIPTGGYFIGDMFGAKNFPDGLLAGHVGAATGWLGIAVWGTLLALASALTLSTLSLLASHRGIAQPMAFESALLLVGAAVICGCFFAGQSVGYRGIFLLLTVPGLLALRRRAAEDRVRRLATQATALVLFVMWQGALTWNADFLDALQRWLGAPVGSALWMALWSARELAWWLLAGILAGVVLTFAVESPAAIWVRRAIVRHSGADSP